ncbi:ATP synthase, F1 complex, gamma subunit [Sesbania bispinosa]|nr:ATP synthase, F1 complex, gamma subunit [Sesbania bispinosa]
MFSSSLTNGVSSKPHLSHHPLPFPHQPHHQTPFPHPPSRKFHSPIRCGIRELRQRIETVKNTQKITEAMKLVAAARVRRAQEAVINGRPFSETLAEVLHDINERLRNDDVEVPLTSIRPVKKVALVVITGDRGLCGGFNNAVGNSFFTRRPFVEVDRFIEGGGFPTTKEAQAIADDVFSLLLVRKLIRLSLCILDAMEDEYFRLTSKDGKLAVERDVMRRKKKKRDDGCVPLMQFEQDPVQILDAMMPLYLNSQILRGLQESLASELAARMGAMANATDNAT